jgi:hypothetical protein
MRSLMPPCSARWVPHRRTAQVKYRQRIPLHVTGLTLASLSRNGTIRPILAHCAPANWRARGCDPGFACGVSGTMRRFWLTPRTHPLSGKEYSVNERLRIAIALAAIVLATGACSESAVAPVLAGEWGGEHIGLVITASGGALEYDCAHGTIDTPIDVGAGGRFIASGTHTFEHGGPVREGETTDLHAAEYRGRIRGGTMTLTVTLTDTTQTIGTFTLLRGGNPMVFKCL